MKGKITISRPLTTKGDGYISISVRDEDAGIDFLKIQIELADFAEALTGLAMVECNFETNLLEKVGKKCERKELVFEVPNFEYSERKDGAYKIAQSICFDGWEPSPYFSSQNSFFEKGGIKYARTKACRWVDKDAK